MLAQGQLQECKLHPSKASGESMCERRQLYISSQQGLYLKVWAEFCSFSAASFAHLPSATSSSYLSLQPAPLFPVDQQELWVIPHLILNSEQYLIPWHPPQVVNGLCSFSFCPLITAGAEKHLWGLSTLCSQTVDWALPRCQQQALAQNPECREHSIPALKWCSLAV